MSSRVPFVAALALCPFALQCSSGSDSNKSGTPAPACSDLGSCCAALIDSGQRESCNSQLVSASSGSDPQSACTQLLVPYSQLCPGVGTGGSDGGSSGKACDDLAACCKSMSIESVRNSCLQSIDTYKNNPKADSVCADALAGFEKQHACDAALDGGAGTGGGGSGGAAGSSGTGPAPDAGGSGGTGPVVPPDWHCPPQAYADGTTCDCGCWVHDPDCDKGLPQSPTGCQPGWSCDGDNCQLAVPGGWTCDPNTFAEGARFYALAPPCDCGCGAHDPDCDIVVPLFGPTPIGGACKGWDTCVNDQCVAGECHPFAADCIWDNVCCDGYCTAGHCDTQAKCRAKDQACVQSFQCCHGSCQGSKCVCVAIGACTQDSDCCSSTCDKQNGASSGNCKCDAQGSICVEDAECCSNLCYGENGSMPHCI